MVIENRNHDKFYRGEYLEFFVNFLVSNEFGTMENCESIDAYKLNHSNLSGLVVEVSKVPIRFLHCMTLDVSLKGLTDFGKNIRGQQKHILRNVFII